MSTTDLSRGATQHAHEMAEAVRDDLRALFEADCTPGDLATFRNGAQAWFRTIYALALAWALEHPGDSMNQVENGIEQALSYLSICGTD